MNKLERNLIESFNLVKSDIAKLQTLALQLSNEQKTLLTKIEVLERKSHPSPKKAIKKAIEKKAPKRKTTRFVSAKGSKKFHIDSCLFAQNIIPKNKVHYKSKVKALNESLKPCKCVN